MHHELVFHQELAMVLLSTSSGVIVLIGGAFIVAFLAMKAQINRYRSELSWLKTASDSFACADKGDESFDTGVPSDSLVGRFINAVQAEVPVKEAADLSHRRDEAYPSTVLATTILSLLLVAGLAGTLFAFKDALGEPPVTGQAGGSINNQAIQDYALDVYVGIRGAFWPSVVGICATIFLYAMRGGWAFRLRDSLFAEMEDFGYRLTKGLTSPKPSSAHEIALIGATTKLTEAATQIQTAAQGIKDTFSKAGELSSALDSSAKSIKNAATELQKPADALLKAFEGTKSPLVKRLSELATTVESFQAQVEKTAESAATHRTEMAALLSGNGEHLKALTELVSRLEAAEKLQTSQGTKIEAIGQTLQDNIKAQQSANREVVDSMAKIVAEQSKAGVNLVAEMQTLLIRTRSEITEAITKAGTTSGEALKPALTAIADANRALNESGTKFSSDIKGSVSNVGAELGKAVTASGDALKPVLATMEETNKRILDAGEQVQGLCTALVKSLDSLLGLPQQISVLPELVSQMDRSMRDFRQQAERNTAELKRAVQQMPNSQAPAPEQDQEDVKAGRWSGALRKMTFWRR